MPLPQGEPFSRRVGWRIGTSAADNTALAAITTQFRLPGQVVLVESTNVLWRYDATSTAAAGPTVIVPSDSTGRWLAVSYVGAFGSFKQPVRVRTAAALPAYARVANVITAAGNGALPAVDGVALAAGNRLLLHDADAAAGADVGVYDVTSLGAAGAPWVLTRSTDADTSAEVTSGMLVIVSEGTLYADTAWTLTTNDPITLNTTALAFVQVPFEYGAAGSLASLSTTAAAAAGTNKGAARIDHRHVFALTSANTAGRPAAAAAGLLHNTTDVDGGALERDTGAAWAQITPGMVHGLRHLLGAADAIAQAAPADLPTTTAAAVAGAAASIANSAHVHRVTLTASNTAGRPAAAAAGLEHLTTDVDGGALFRDDGGAWNQIAPGMTHGLRHLLGAADAIAQAAPADLPTTTAAAVAGAAASIANSAHVHRVTLTESNTAGRPAAAAAGLLHNTTDVDGGALHRDTGAAWTQITPGLTHGLRHLLGAADAIAQAAPADLPTTTAAAVAGAAASIANSAHVHVITLTSSNTAGRPAPALAGLEHYTTDVDGGALHRDTGAAWTQITPGMTHGAQHAAAGGDPASGLAPSQVAVMDAAGLGFALRLRKAFAAGGGGADDVTIYNAAVPRNMKIVDVYAIVATAGAGGSTWQLRSAAAGGGVALSDALSSAATGYQRTAVITATQDVAAASSIYLRRSDNTSAGEVVIELMAIT